MKSGLARYAPEIEAATAELRRREVIRRIWRKDHTLWKPEPDEIADRLGWLHVSAAMREKAADLCGFADEVRAAGYRHVVLLGMGGSSLGPLVLSQAFGRAQGHPELVVLDSTVPAAIRVVTDAIDTARALFLVSSKSGTTVEPNALYRFFRSAVEQSAGKTSTGESFAAITDPGTPLESLAREHGFRRVFVNPPDIGGRYSVQSYFGLVPAALMGLDVTTTLGRVDDMREVCASFDAAHDNPGARLGAIMGAMARNGRDKLTLITSPTISGFGLWVEQLVAESTGKEGTGIVPVSGEPLQPAASYGQDRLFVYVRLGNDDNSETDAACQCLLSCGQPLLRIDLRDRYDLWREFFRWEFATAVAGSLLRVNPFDQPNVQQSKDLTARALSSGAFVAPRPETKSPRELLSDAKAGDYLALMAFLRQTPELDAAFSELRRSVMTRHTIATTLGYGPRFLHSTGQLHKGGPNSGLFLQITANHQDDLPVPNAPYTFGALARAQAEGDLRALQAMGRRVARVELEADAPDAIRRLLGEMG